MHGIQGTQSAIPATHQSRADDLVIGALASTLNLALANRPESGDPWVPDNLAWDALSRLAALAKPLASVEARTFVNNIRQCMTGVRRDSPDDLLLDSILDNCFDGGKTPLTEHLAAKAFKCLDLPHLTVLEPGEFQPSSRTFNSLLPSLALGVHEYGPFGRTLLWHGARHMLAGLSGDASEWRVEALQKVIFSYANEAHPGEAGGPTIEAFVEELDLLDSHEDIYEDTTFDFTSAPVVV
ncbi:hypothetical protein [Pandoraea commovens]|uniref:Uncharacterized protein n=1 Tax=Pandoraea commovens TaxID=2508289 RepID=A0A5E4RV60_9BURK|nr:hypothetical protein [Pandoraea commovens]VVD66925.1 hypothetical protein PCO31010_00404 [Pandoraea commovens]